ncbi:hypothetical protein [Cohaesibacter marisflavi]|uniref:hypothetical protein n=1 Tax=Cohaesibacter marisflavi TaxID=655353 RepID=UPI0029C6BB4C|nr:hypothetical protein [Cohaesibacter marisflavi]
MPSERTSVRQPYGQSRIEVDAVLTETLQLCLVKPNLKEVWLDLNNRGRVSSSYSSFMRSLKSAVSYRDFSHLRSMARTNSHEHDGSGRGNAGGNVPTTENLASVSQNTSQNSEAATLPTYSKTVDQSRSAAERFRNSKDNPFRKIDRKKRFEF